MAAGNEWLSGYLEAILDSGVSLEDVAREGSSKTSDSEMNEQHGGGGEKSSSRSEELMLSDLRGQAATAIRYFVGQATGFDEEQLHRTWIKASSEKNVHDRSTRLENFCWRIWHLSRKRKQVELEETKRREDRQREKQAVHGELPEEMLRSEETEAMVREGEQEEVAELMALESRKDEKGEERGKGGKERREEDESEEESQSRKRLYIVLISMHGLVRGENMELGKDSDTGGQVKYVVELARALATMPQVYRVDLLTRQITSPDVDFSYWEPVEMLGSADYEAESAGESAGAFIVRIPCGPREVYLRKELLWPYVGEFVDGALAHIVQMSEALAGQVGNGSPVWPYVIHGHYADAADAAALLSGALNVPLVVTGHSLGRNKQEQLLKQGRLTMAEIDEAYKITRRIEAEEFGLDAAELVVTSTRQEIEQQWGIYDGFDLWLEGMLRAQQKRGKACYGRFMPRMAVIPPGMDFSHVSPPDIDASETDGPQPAIWGEIRRFFSNPHKPMVLALARPDPKKNLTTLVKAFGESKPLRDLANLVLIMGNRDDIDAMGGTNAEVLTAVLKLVDKYDMYGQVAYPKRHKQSEVPDIYGLAARSKGVFVNPALVEPFGLTLIEAAARGLPMVATKNGGPVDIQKTLSNGLLVDPHDSRDIASALFSLVSDRKLWHECRSSALANIHKYSWPEHCCRYLARITQCRLRHPQWRAQALFDAISGNKGPSFASQESSLNSDSLRDIRDLSLRLSVDGKYFLGGNAEGASLSEMDREKLHAKGDLKELFGGGASSMPRFRSFGGSVGRERHFASMEGEAVGREGMSGAAGGWSDEVLPSGMKLRLRRKLVVVAVDDYESDGKVGDNFVSTLRAVLSAVQSGHVGIGIATALAGHEILGVLVASGVGLSSIDVVIAGGGSELFYPIKSPPDGSICMLSDGEGWELVLDPDYFSHIEYRWSPNDVRQSIPRVVVPPNILSSMRDKGDIKDLGKEMGDVGLDEEHLLSSSRCLCFRVKDPVKLSAPEEIRKRLRMRGLRSNVVFCRSAAFLYAMPLHASRVQALRYLFVRWGIDVSNMVVVIGDKGDGDHCQLLSGAHHTLILKDAIGDVDADHTRLLTSLYAPQISTLNKVFLVESTMSVLDALKKFNFV